MSPTWALLVRQQHRFGTQLLISCLKDLNELQVFIFSGTCDHIFAKRYWIEIIHGNLIFHDGKVFVSERKSYVGFLN